MTQQPRFEPMTYNCWPVTIGLTIWLTIIAVSQPPRLSNDSLSIPTSQNTTYHFYKELNNTWRALWRYDVRLDAGTCWQWCWQRMTATEERCVTYWRQLTACCRLILPLGAASTYLQIAISCYLSQYIIETYLEKWDTGSPTTNCQLIMASITHLWRL